MLVTVLGKKKIEHLYIVQLMGTVSIILVLSIHKDEFFKRLQIIHVAWKKFEIIRDCISADMLGRSVRDSQPCRCKYLSLLSCPIDGWISTKLSHHEGFSPSSLGTPEKSGVLIRLLEQQDQ